MKQLFTLLMAMLMLLAVACDDDKSDDDGTGGDADSDTDSDTDGDGDVDWEPTGECADGPLATSVPDCQPTLPPSTGDYHEDCYNVINAFRAQCQCLPPLQRWTDGEACADEQAEYDGDRDSAHAGFSARICESGSAQCECPGWGSVDNITHTSDWGETCLEMMWHEVDNPGGEQGHYEAMSSTRHTRVACGLHVADNGDVWALQNYD